MAATDSKPTDFVIKVYESKALAEEGEDNNALFKQLNHKYLLAETCYHKDEFMDCLEIVSCGS